MSLEILHPFLHYQNPSLICHGVVPLCRSLDVSDRRSKKKGWLMRKIKEKLSVTTIAATKLEEESNRINSLDFSLYLRVVTTVAANQHQTLGDSTTTQHQTTVTGVFSSLDPSFLSPHLLRFLKRHPALHHFLPNTLRTHLFLLHFKTLLIPLLNRLQALVINVRPQMGLQNPIGGRISSVFGIAATKILYPKSQIPNRN